MPEDLTPRFGNDITARGFTSTTTDFIPPVHDDATVISTSPLLTNEPPATSPPPNEFAQTLIGQQLGDVRLEEVVGAGGMGTVFRGIDTRLDRTVAVKVLARQQTSADESKSRFEMEARSAARLDHPNIARVHYVGEERGHRFLVFEYIDGTNLRDAIHASGPLPLADALRCMLQITDALVHAWQRDVVHRDIKPSNILLTPEGQAKLVDMGLARFEHADVAGQDLTATGVTLGTFDYMAPEQARDARHADIRSDIYSLGCTFFFILTGQPPFPEGGALQKLLKHQNDPPPSLHDWRPDVPESVVEILDSMLAKQPEDRFQTPAELLAALSSVSEHLGLVYPQISLPSGRETAVVTPPLLRVHAPWLIPLVLLLLSVLGLGIVWNRQQAEPDFPELRIDNSVGGTSGTVGTSVAPRQRMLDPTE